MSYSAITDVRIGFLVAALLVVLIHPPSHSQESESLNLLLEEASKELTYFNFDLAYKLYGQAVDKAGSPGSDVWLQATFGRALSAQHRSPATRDLIEEAIEGYQSIADQAPQTPFAARSVLNLGRIDEIRDYLGDEIDLEGAREHYRRVFETWPDLDAADQAALFYAGTYFQDFKNLDGVKLGLEFLEGWITDRDDRDGASMTWEVMGQVRYHHLQDYAGAVRCFIKADDLGLTDPNGAGVLYWQLGQAAQNELDDLPTAIRYYQKIITDAPRSGRAFNAQLALEDLQEKRPDLNIEIPEVQLFLAKPEELLENEDNASGETGDTP
ncbi:tetratricopeptide repeat protein [Algisphaera agarilytica]|uniref:Tetratricopeptide (TPR) repeat protein n=1 Tax=Algisphaera agarilytica TaxID=1385975 RepID=A0A7X0H5L7_9BACT|nr:tetratricopeptide repeat protein [Algisphaera agarilytica]MBB6428556.1 tetratricopeptide (TPR) repeat protein [Algisphaera agarilytica]